MRFCPIAGGSSGNALYIGTEKEHILVDAGVSGKRIYAALESIGVSKINALFLTHEHIDHCSGAAVVSKRFGAATFATEGTWQAMRQNIKGERYKISHLRSVNLGSLRITPFNIPHDAAEPVGFLFESENKKIGVVTDIGYATDSVIRALDGCDALLIEANHDVDMLIKGSYPARLKERVLGAYGHLSNKACGALLTRITRENCKRIYLGHLSAENNTPELALETVLAAFSANEIIPPKIAVVERSVASPCIEV